MAESGRTVYIAGAGISGLTLALALAKFGVTVVVLERNDTLGEFGAGLQISPNAHRVLDHLGLTKATAAASLEPAGIDVYPFGRKAPLITLTLGTAARLRFGAPYVVMHRADLVRLLFDATKRFANIDVLFGIENFDMVSHARGISVSIDEQHGKSRHARPFAFVGADGVRSRTRMTMLGGPPPRYSGYVAWRTLADMPALNGIVALDRTSVLFGPGYHAVTYPLPHRGQVNIVLVTRESETRAFADPPVSLRRLQVPVKRSRRFDALIEAAGANFTHWPLSAVTTPLWHKGAVGLIGDAAHATLPFQAQGAAMAIEDAAILAPLLANTDNAEHAFARYAELRQARAARIQAISARNGRIFHMHWPASIARDLAISGQGETGHFQRLDWLYDYDPVALATPH